MAKKLWKKRVKKPATLASRAKSTITNLSKRCQVSRQMVREWATPLLEDVSAGGRLCEYCFAPLNLDNVGFDHKVPISRGGDRWGANLTLCCQPCNKIKGALSDSEYSSLLELINAWDDLPRKNVLMRLRLGGTFFGGWKGKQWRRKARRSC